MAREIKFRAWDGKRMRDVFKMLYLTANTSVHFVHGHVHYNETVGAFGYKTTDGRFFGLNSKILLSAEIVGNIYEHQHLFPPCTH
jgi:hypothetical protein